MSSNCRVGGQWGHGALHGGAWMQRAEGVWSAENWLADPQKQRLKPPGNSSSLTVTPCNKENINEN